MGKYFDDDSSGERQEAGNGGLPSEAQLVMLCLDYLRDLRRSYQPHDLLHAEGLDANYLSVAIYGLSRSLVRPSQLSITGKDGNDAFFDQAKVGSNVVPIEDDLSEIVLPDISTINKEILYNSNPTPSINTTEDLTVDTGDPVTWYEYDDTHSSNSHRFYLLNGLASGPNLRGPLSLGEITAAGMAGLGARSRLEAEREMVKSDLFEQFVGAVRAKGFFRDPANEGPSETPMEAELKQQRAAEVYEDRYRKVVAKFRQKLATKAQQAFAAGDTESVMSGNPVAISAAEKIRQRREKRIDAARSRTILNNQHGETHQDENTQPQDDSKDMAEAPSINSLTQKMIPLSPQHNQQNPVDLDEAERLKSTGNMHMQKKEYELAADSYTAALKLSPAGPQSHVYFSNRAAALLSMKKFEEAILDSERSLALMPDYGKAHSRLGLAHFLLGNYRQAIEAYTVSLKYEPENQSSKNYLEKAKKRYAAKQVENRDEEAPSSFSVVSEWEKSGVTSAIENQDGRQNIIDQKEAEKFKHKGNSHMASREYQLALDAYTEAVRLCKDGPNSHVYFSNRAASLCYLERYEEAEIDSERSLKLKPEYGKAHARLGLSRFFMGDYEGAVEAYTAALEYDPNNSASKSYLAKAKARLGRSKGRDETTE